MARGRPADPLIARFPRERNILHGAARRCHGKTPHKDYGERGIIVADRYRFGENGMTGFACFMNDMGPCPSPKHSLDRINVNRGYEPGNLRWATQKQQMRNTRRTVLAVFDGCRVAAADLVESVSAEAQTVGKEAFTAANARKQSRYKSRMHSSGKGKQFNVIASHATRSSIKALAEHFGSTQSEALRLVAVGLIGGVLAVERMPPIVRERHKRVPRQVGSVGPVSAAERVKQWKARKSATGEGTGLNLICHPLVHAAIKRLASEHGVSLEEALRRVVASAVAQMIPQQIVRERELVSA